MRSRLLALVALSLIVSPAAAQDDEQLFPAPIDVRVPHISTDKSVKYDYDIVYVRAPRAGDKVHKRFYLDFSSPVVMEPGADLMLLHPEGREELRRGGLPLVNASDQRSDAPLADRTVSVQAANLEGAS